MGDLGPLTQKGWIYLATLNLDTPLEVLRNHGRTIPLDGIRIEHGRFGGWHAHYPASSLLTTYSCGGLVSGDGGDVLPFLIAYRTIIEDEARTAQSRVDAVRVLVDDPTYARFSRMLGEKVATDWLAAKMCDELNIARMPARSLVQAGHLDRHAVLRLSDAELRAVPRVGPRTIAAIRLSRTKSAAP